MGATQALGRKAGDCEDERGREEMQVMGDGERVGWNCQEGKGGNGEEDTDTDS